MTDSPLVLVIEDEASLTTLLRYNLEIRGFRVASIANGGDAMGAIAAATPDLVLLDWMLPGVSGIEICRKIRRDPQTRALPVILLTARGELSFHELRDATGGRAGDRRGVRMGTLDEHLAIRGGATGAPGHLHQQREGPFRRAEVGQTQGSVRIDDAHQLYARQVQTLGHHLRTDQDVDAAVAQAFQQLHERPPPTDRVGIRALDPRIRQHAPQLDLDPLRPEPRVPDVQRSAFRARAHRHRPVAAVVAQEPPRRAMQRQRDRATLAGHRVVAGPTVEVVREAAAVQKQDALPAFGMHAAQRVGELGSQHPAVRAALHEMHPRRRPAPYPPLQVIAMNRAGLHAEESLRRRRGAPHHQTSALGPASMRRHLTSVIARAGG